MTVDDADSALGRYRDAVTRYVLLESVSKNKPVLWDDLIREASSEMYRAGLAIRQALIVGGS